MMMSWSESPTASLLSRAGSREVVETAISLSKQQQTTWEPIRGSRIRRASSKQRAKTQPSEITKETDEK
jgi:hypothetical protein